MTVPPVPPGLRAIRVLGRGPLTMTLLCHTAAGESVVVKTMAAQTPDPDIARDALNTEAHVRSNVRHPGILPLLALYESPDGPQIVSPYLADGALNAHLSVPLDRETALGLIDQVADALDAVHRCGWVIGDLGAANILCEWSTGRFLIADFGAAQREHARPPARRQLSSRGCPPELLRGLPATRASDVFAFSRLADVCLPTGRPSGIAAALRHGAHPDPQLRPASAGAFAAALRQAWPADPPTPPRTAPPDTRPALARRSPGASPVEAATTSRTDAITRLSERLAELDDSLSAGERLALRAVLQRAERSVAQATSAITAVTVETFGRAEALAAFEETGLAHALAAAPLTAAEAARLCGLAAGPTTTVLDLMTTLAVVTRTAMPDRQDHSDQVYQAEATYRLAPAVAARYAGDDDVRRCRPIAEARQFWAELTHWLYTGTASAPLDGDRTGAGYRNAVMVLGEASTGDAQVLAGLLADDPVITAARWIVDIGAGSGVWSRSLLRLASSARLLLLDRLHVLLAATDPCPGPEVVAADWSALPLAPHSVDVAVLANVCHLEDGAGAATLIGAVADILRPAGRLVLVDTIGDGLDQGALLQSMHLGLRTRRGRVHPESSYRRWFAEAGLTVLSGHRLPSGFSARIATRSPG